MNAQSASINSSSEKKYFNLHTSGVGYLSNIREIKPKKGKVTSFLSCNIAALVGDSEEPEYRFFNMNVSGKDNETLIKKCQKSVDEGKKVLVSFVMSDLWFNTFIYKTDSDYHKKGDTGVALKGRLFHIKMIKIDGEIKYQEPREMSTDENRPEAQSAELPGNADNDDIPL